MNNSVCKDRGAEARILDSNNSGVAKRICCIGKMEQAEKIGKFSGFLWCLAYGTSRKDREIFRFFVVPGLSCYKSIFRDARTPSGATSKGVLQLEATFY